LQDCPALATRYRPVIAPSSVIYADGFDALACQAPNEARPSVEQFAGRPSRFGRLASPLVEEASAIVEGKPTLPFRHAAGFWQFTRDHASR
jgi:hypothetical protein